MRHLFALLVVLLFIATAEGSEIFAIRAGHPKLLLSDDALKAAVVAAKSDTLRAALHARIVATAENILIAPSARHIPASNASLDQARYALHYILTSAFAYRLTGDERFLERAKRELFNVAAFTDWNPGHFLDVGEMSFAVSIGYDWLYAELTPEEREVLKRAILEKALSFADAAYAPDGPTDKRVSWAKETRNWNQVCNAGLLCAALVIADEEPVVAQKVIAGVRASLPRGMAAYAPDGQYPEGPGYWTFGTTYNVIALAALESALGTDLGLAKAPGFDRTADYLVAVQGPFGRAFNYADSTDDLQNSPARAWLANRFRQFTALRNTRELLDESLRKESVTPFDPTIQGQVVNRFFPLHAIWFPEETRESSAAPDLPLDLHFRGAADIAVLRSAWGDPRAIFVGFKAGGNAIRHGHLDLGSFVLDADGQRWAIDLGPDTYELPGFFDYKDKRWAFFRVNNHSHNTVTPGGALQRLKAVAPITAFGNSAERGFAVADLTAAYPDEVVSLRRGIALLDRARVLVQDEFEPAKPGLPLRWVMVTGATIELAKDGRSASLTQAGRQLRVQLLESDTARLSIASTRPPTVAENQNEGTAMLVVEVAPADQQSMTRLAVLLTPVGEKWPQLEAPVIQPLSDWR